MRRRGFTKLALAVVPVMLAAQGCTRPLIAGKQLREALVEAHDACSRGEAPRSSPIAGNCDVTETAAKFLQPGMTFDAAERLLKEAGLTVTPRGPKPRFRNVYDVAGTMELKSSWFSRSSLVVALTPDDPATYARVRQVTARIYTS